MKNSLLLIALVVALQACTKPHPRATTAFPTELNPAKDWVTYEGITHVENGDSVFTVLSLQTVAPGLDSRYRMVESLYHPEYTLMSSSSGAYRVLSGGTGNYIIQLIDKKPVQKFWKGTKDLRFKGLPGDLFFRNEGQHRLLLVDENFEASDPKCSLHRRSDLFTVEGYLTVYPDTAEFYEKNTQKKWAVARFGYYYDAVKNYHLLAKQRHEGIYLKALSYSTPESDPDGNEIDALVFKRILQMDTLKFFQ
jgi:hypothetical protein